MSITEQAPAERDFLDLVDTDEGWRLIERFSELVRESGTADEHSAADYIVERLKALGIPVTCYQPELYISLPRGAALTAKNGTGTRPIKAKTPSFSLPTSGRPVSGAAVYLSSKTTRGTEDLFANHVQLSAQDLSGTIVVAEGFSMPTTVRALEHQGVAGVVFVNPGEDIHEMICTTVWGNPTPESLQWKPRVPVVNVSRSDGEWVMAQLEQGPVELSMETSVDEGWKECALPLARIEGSVQPEQFLLVHGHYDSWHVGIGDNATGNAALLELARILHARRDLLRRSVWIAWWPGHSTGRYAGSTWFADHFGLELRKNCVGQVNIDSPGCRGATAFEEVMWMAECEKLCRDVITDRTGRTSHRLRPLRAGDYSFNQIGLSSYFMLLSNRPKSERDELGFYPVGGCGGDTAWHTERDTLDVADREILAQDIGIYVSATVRTVNADVLPYDFRTAVDELKEAVASYRDQAGDRFSLEDIDRHLGELESELADFYGRLPQLAEADAETVNRILIELARYLVPLNYSFGSRFDHDPAEPLGAIPKLRDIERMSHLAADSDEFKFFENSLVRQRNKVANALFEATEMIRNRVALIG